MLYNSLDYMGMPIDVIIKDFRDYKTAVSFSHLVDVPDIFFEYLQREFKVLGEDEDEHVDVLISVLMSRVRQRFLDVYIAESARQSGRRRNLNPANIFRATVNDGINILKQIEDCECYYDLTIDDFLGRYSHVFEGVIKDVFEDFPLANDDKDLLRQFSALSLIKNYYSPIHTGFVFAGFGNEELFPSLQSFRFDGMIMGRLKKVKRESVTIDASKVRAKIIPFAQHEIVDRFLVGIDERHERAIIDNVRRNLEDVGNSLIGSLRGIRSQTRNRLRANLRTSIDTVLTDLRDLTIRELKEESAAESEDAVMFMAKPDLANFAEALVNITSVKRRASLETESVGGPIDVAVISRDDGFVWVKRKHYFDPDLNPRFFMRKYGTLGQR